MRLVVRDIAQLDTLLDGLAEHAQCNTSIVKSSPVTPVAADVPEACVRATRPAAVEASCRQVRITKKMMVVGEGLLGARLALRVVACGNAFSLRSNRTLVEASHPSRGQNIAGRSDGGGGRITRAAPRPSGRCLRQRFSLRSNRTLVEASHPSPGQNID
jgi:hypothetical protein